MKNIGTKALIASLLIVGSIAASAQPFNYAAVQRNSDDDQFITTELPELYATTTPSLVASKGDGTNSVYWFLGSTLRLDPANWLSPGGKLLSVDLASVNPYDIGNMTDLLDAKLNVTAFASSASQIAGIQAGLASATGTMASIQSLALSNNTFVFAVNANMFGTSTNMTVANASTTNGLVSRTAWNALVSQVNGLATSTVQIQSDWTQASTTARDYIKNKPADRVFTNPSRSFNSSFRVSTTTISNVSYSISIANVLTLTGGAAGLAILEYADDSGFTTNVKEVGRIGNSNTGGLVVGLTLNDQITAQVAGMVPAGKYVRIRTSNTTGTPTYTLISAQEVY